MPRSRGTFIAPRISSSGGTGLPRLSGRWRGLVDSAVPGVEGRLKAEKEPHPDWLKCGTDKGRGKLVPGGLLIINM